MFKGVRCLTVPSAVIVGTSVLLILISKKRRERTREKDAPAKNREQGFTKESETFLLLGDSITQESFLIEKRGFGLLLSSWYIRRLDVINKGLSGYNSRWTLLLLPNLITKFKNKSPTIITLLLGSNDCVTPEITGNQHVPLEEYKNNMISIIKILKEWSPTAAIILLTPPPIDETAWMRRCNEKYNANCIESNRLNKNVELYCTAILEIGDEMNIKVIDLFHGLQSYQVIDSNVDPPYRKHLSDGLHLSASGNQFVFDSIKKVIKDHYSHLKGESEGEEGTSTLPLFYPNYSEVLKPSNPKEILL